jgi:hypothetical protein
MLPHIMKRTVTNEPVTTVTPRRATPPKLDTMREASRHHSTIHGKK